MYCPSCGNYLETRINRCPHCAVDISASFWDELATDQTVVPTETLEEVGIRAGMILEGKYRIESLISRGGMGAVYLGTDITLERKVAIKFLAEQFKSDQELVFRFHREARVIAGLDHPNIVPVYTVGEQEGHYYFVMKLVEGLTIKEVIQQKGALNIKIAVDIIRQVCDGLEHIHEMGYAHRDIKSQNIIIDTKGRALILDFGIIRQMEGGNLTQTGVSTGTPEYIAPEQAREAKQADGRSDIYSLGITFYEMLVGRTPFKATTAMDLIIMHINEPPDPPCSRRADLPPVFDDIVLKMLAKNPEDRFQTIGEVRDAVVGTGAPAMAPSQSGILFGITEELHGRTFSNVSPAREAAMEKFGTSPGSQSATGMSGESVPRTVAPTRRFRIVLPLSILIVAGIGLWVYFALKDPPDRRLPPKRLHPAVGQGLKSGSEKAEARRLEKARKLAMKAAFEKAERGRKLAADKARKLALALKKGKDKVDNNGQEEARKLAPARKKEEARKLALARKKDKARKLALARKKDKARKLALVKKREEAQKLALARKKDKARKLALARKRAAESYGKITFSSKPTGAIVYGDGKRLGITPIIKKLPKGVITIKVALKDYEIWQQKYRVLANRTTSIKVSLRPLPGKLRVIALYNGEPVMGARVYLNKKKVLGTTPLVGSLLKPGHYSITVKKKGFKLFTCPMIVIKSGKRAKCTAILGK